ncbi:MAG: TonB-dependent receptor [Acidobacteriota bacterium]|nr:TonB-dependent receptor [Acidobacteriota bacterium]
MSKSNINCFTKVFLFVMLVVSGITPIVAQDGSAILRGEVLDPSGAVVPGATVSIANQETGLNRRSVTTNDSGGYVFASLTPGLYRITVEAAGFKKSVKEDFRLNVGETQEFKFSMETGGAQETVTVTTEEPLVETSTSKIGGQISQEELTELPSVNRNFIGFVGLLPGVVPNISTESFGSDSVSVNGQDPRYNNFALDGANNNDDVIGARAGSQARVALEAVQEFQVLTNQFSAEFGRTSGGIINAVTKSGKNTVFGSAFGFFQDNALNSKNRFSILRNADEADTSFKQFGGTIGGPIKRDFAHFFFSYERTKIDQGVNIDIFARPALNASTVTATRATNILLRGDMQPSQKHQISIRYLRENSPQLNQIIPVGVLPVSLAAAREEADVDQTTVGSYTYNLTANLLNDLRLSFTREDVAFASAAFNAGKSLVELPPTLVFNTFVDQQSNVAQARINNSYRLADTLTWIKGSHTLKFGVDYNYVTADSTSEDNLNGTFFFPTDLPFDRNNPRSYPERFSIRVGGPLKNFMINHNTSVFVQDDWKVNRKLTLNLGARYDDETVSSDNNNISPRLGFAYDPSGNAKTVIRGGFGMFYQNTPFEIITAFRTGGPFSTSFVRNFPLNSADPGPRAGVLPTDPTLANGPVVNRALIASLVGTGALLANATPTVDNNERRMPYTRSFSIGFQRELVSNMAVTADYIHTDGIDQFLTINLNPGRRATTNSTAAISRQFTTLGAVIQNSLVPVITDSFGNFPFQTARVAGVTTRINAGKTKYDALQLSLDKRYSRGFQFKASYTLSKGTGNVSGSAFGAANFQTQTSLGLEENEGPTSFDRRHNFVFSGLYRIPRTRGLVVSTIVRTLSGTPFTIFDSRVDTNQNGISFDPLPSGAFTNSRPFANGETLNFAVDNKGGINGARLPGFFSVDLRLAYKFNFTERVKAGFTFEVFNLANRVNYDENTISGNTAQATFLIPSGAKPARTFQLGFRVAF